jgi:hypothetical protein
MLGNPARGFLVWADVSNLVIAAPRAKQKPRQMPGPLFGLLDFLTA